MTHANFSEQVLNGKDKQFQDVVIQLKKQLNFDFVAIGVTPFLGAPLKWMYSAGATNDRYRRISLAPGHGIGGIVIKSAKPMLLTNIDRELDPRAYSSYPIVFAEGLHSFCALPLMKGGRSVGALLCAYRSVDENHSQSFRALVSSVSNGICGLDVNTTDFVDFDALLPDSQEKEDAFVPYSTMAMLTRVQEETHHRIARNIHDGVAQEVLGATWLLRRVLDAKTQDEAQALVCEALQNLEFIQDELHDISVELRPSTLDHFGFAAALRSRAVMLESTYGVRTIIEGPSHELPRFDPVIETQVYRICQEAMLNACKYANVDQIRVQIDHASDWIYVSVIDEGPGFNVDAPPILGSGCGLFSMRERAKMINAVLDVESGPSGTTVSLTAPTSIPTNAPGNTDQQGKGSQEPDDRPKDAQGSAATLEGDAR